MRDLGWGSVRHYIQSGNLVFTAIGSSATLETELENAVEKRFVPFRFSDYSCGGDWPAYIAGNPFPEASAKEPKFVMLTLSKSPPKSGAVRGIAGTRFEGRASGGGRRSGFTFCRRRRIEVVARGSRTMDWLASHCSKLANRAETSGYGEPTTDTSAA